MSRQTFLTNYCNVVYLQFLQKNHLPSVPQLVNKVVFVCLFFWWQKQHPFTNQQAFIFHSWGLMKTVLGFKKEINTSLNPSAIALFCIFHISLENSLRKVSVPVLSFTCVIRYGLDHQISGTTLFRLTSLLYLQLSSSQQDFPLSVNSSVSIHILRFGGWRWCEVLPLSNLTLSLQNFHYKCFVPQKGDSKTRARLAVKCFSVGTLINRSNSLS